MGGWKVDQNTSHIETIIHVQKRSKECKTAVGNRKTKIQAACQEMKVHDILPDEVEYFDAIIQNAI